MGFLAAIVADVVVHSTIISRQGIVVRGVARDPVLNAVEVTFRAEFFVPLAGGRRPVHPDPQVDLRLAVLTAMAHLRQPRLDYLVSALEDEDAMVRWTAARLLGHLQPGHPALQQAARDPDPLVRQRAQTVVNW